jgi:hypothetical protein
LTSIEDLALTKLVTTLYQLLVEWIEAIKEAKSKTEGNTRSASLLQDTFIYFVDRIIPKLSTLRERTEKYDLIQILPLVEKAILAEIMELETVRRRIQHEGSRSRGLKQRSWNFENGRQGIGEHTRT